MHPEAPGPQRLRIPASLARLADVRQLVRQATRAAGADSDTVDDLVQAVDEAATNVIIHGFGGGSGHLEVVVEVVGRTLVITLEDDGPAFDPTILPDPDMTVDAVIRGPGGMGIRLMRMGSDNLAYRPRPGGGNILTLTRNLAPRQQEDRSMALQTIVEHADVPVPVTIIALDGELDAASYEHVIETIRGAREAGASRLLLDLTNLSFISSSGLVAVHSAMRLMRGEAPPDPEQGWEALRAIRDEVEGGATMGNLRLCGTQDAVQKVLDRTGLGGLIPSHPDRATALAAF